METLKTRINQLIEDLNLNKNEFAREVGISSAMISKITIKDVNFGIDVYKKIIDRYPHLNQQWLLSGEGEMWLENHTQNPHLSTHLSDTATAIINKSPAFQAVLKQLMKNSKEFRAAEENNDSVPYRYQRHIYDLLRVNNPDLYKISKNIDIMLGLKDIIFELEKDYFDTLQKAFWQFRKGDFNIQEYEKQVVEALKEFKKSSETLEKLVAAILIFYKEMKELGVTKIDFDAYSLNTL